MLVFCLMTDDKDVVLMVLCYVEALTGVFTAKVNPIAKKKKKKSVCLNATLFE